MKIDSNKRVVYSIIVADIQQVAENTLDRPLSPKEIQLVECSLGNYIDWTLAIENAFRECLT